MTMITERPVSLGNPAQEWEQDDIHVWQWTRQDYYRAAEIGFLDPDARLELLDGEILQHMRPHKSSHSTAVLFTQSALADAASPNTFHVRAQMAITLNDRSEPEPDLVVVFGTIGDYAEHHPYPSDIQLLVEVSDSTLRTDRKRKLSAYARANIAEYWILNLVDRQLEVWRDPFFQASGPGFKTSLLYLEKDTVRPLFAPESVFAVADLLPPSTAG